MGGRIPRSSTDFRWVSVHSPPPRSCAHCRASTSAGPSVACAISRFPAASPRGRTCLLPRLPREHGRSGGPPRLVPQLRRLLHAAAEERRAPHQRRCGGVPADGKLSCLGRIDTGAQIHVKGQHYEAGELIGDERDARRYSRRPIRGRVPGARRLPPRAFAGRRQGHAGARHAGRSVSGQQHRRALHAAAVRAQQPRRDRDRHRDSSVASRW